MQRSTPWFWIGAAGLLLLLPGPTGRFLLDLIGGLTLALFLVPLLLAGVAVVAWQLLQRRLQTCEVCGSTSLGSSSCMACGHPFSGNQPTDAPGLRDIDASSVTIDVDAVNVDVKGENYDSG
jgi:hypothetical protein